jgi:hypothetical protein
MSKLREAAQQALEELVARGQRGDGAPDTVAALRAALEQEEQEQEQEPVGYIDERGNPVLLPPRRTWMGRDKEYEQALARAKNCHSDSLLYAKGAQ